MPRYFIEVSYKGTNYSGFQKQNNANSIQAEVERALKIFFKKDFELTGSSRTDAGVHALQNFFHFDLEHTFIAENNIKQIEYSKVFYSIGGEELKGAVYNLNAILPKAIVVKKIFTVKDNAHCRFDALTREYKYYIYQKKNPFFEDRAFYFPCKLNIEILNVAAEKILYYGDFSSFSKRNTQVKDFMCNIVKSEWIVEEDIIYYHVIANRFLRGMVKGLVGTMLKVATNNITVDNFKKIIEDKDQTKTDFSPPSHGLFLTAVNYI